MRFLATTLIALRALRRNKLRSILTALGMIIGVGSVIAAVSLGNGAKTQIEAQVSSMGQNMISVLPGSMTSGGMRTGWGAASSLVPEEADAIRREINGVVAVSPEIRDRTQVIANGLNWNTSLMGEGTEYPSIRAWELDHGDFFTENDVRTAAKVCVIGKTVEEQLFPGQDPVGQIIRARNIPLRIIGVMKDKGFNAMGQDQDDCIIVPYTTAMKRISKRDKLSTILIQAVSVEAIPRVQRDVQDLLTQRRQGRDPDFVVRNQIELAQVFTANSQTMTVLVACIAAVSLIVGGIGIMNIMLVSVTERTREIGIRLAIGAHSRDILLQFLTEAVVLSAIGGILGILGGIGTAKGMTHFLQWPTSVSLPWVVGAALFSAACGVFFGFYPARKAARLDPIDALRFE